MWRALVVVPPAGLAMNATVEPSGDSATVPPAPLGSELVVPSSARMRMELAGGASRHGAQSPRTATARATASAATVHGIARMNADAG